MRCPIKSARDSVVRRKRMVLLILIAVMVLRAIDGVSLLSPFRDSTLRNDVS